MHAVVDDFVIFFFQAEDGIRDYKVTGVQTCALPICSVVNLVLYPGPDGALSILPWSIVNMTGGVFWGLMARRAWFRKYLRSARGSTIAHVWYLTSFGILGGCVMSIPGAFVSAAVSGQSAFALSP